MALTFSGFTNALVAQSSCSSAQFIESGQLTPLEYTGTGEHWLVTENQSVGTHFYLPNEELMEIDSVGIYNDACGSLNLLGMSYPAYGDLGLSFTTTALAPSEVFYIRIFAANAPASFPFSVIVTNSTSPPWCQSLNPCDLLCNPSFENSTTGTFPDPWFMNSYTPNYFVGNPDPPLLTSPRTGSGMVGIVTYYQNVGRPMERESISIPLEQPVPAGKWVYGEMYVRWDDHASGVVNAGLQMITYTDYLEMLFTQGPFNMNPALPTPPPDAQITPLDAQGNSTIGWIDQTSWKKISGVFEVSGNPVDHLTISNFKDDAFTSSHVYDANADFAYTIIDDVDVQEFPGAGDDVTICSGQGSGVQLGTGVCNLPSGASINWTPTTGLNDPTSATPIATVSQTTQYTMSVSYNGVNYEDQVTVNVGELPDVKTVLDDCSYPNSSATFTIPEYSSDNQYGVGSTSGFSYGSMVQNGAQITFNDINYTDYKDVGEFTINITSGPQNGCSFSGKIVKCCNTSGEIALSREALTDRGDINDWEKHFVVADYFTFDDDITIENATFFMHPDAQIRITEDAKVDFINCTFTTDDCDPAYRWDGIMLEGEAGEKFTIDASVMEHSMRGIYIDGAHRPVEVTNNTFDNNRYTIMLLNQTEEGPYHDIESSWLKAEGNEFKQTCDFGLGFCFETQHPSSPLNLYSYYLNSTVKFTGFDGFSQSSTGPIMASNSLMHVLIKNVDHFQFGGNNGNLNDFTGDFNLHDVPHIFIENSTGKLSSNRFISSGVGHIGLHQSDVIIGGASANERNIFDSKHTTFIRGVHASESKFYIAHNIFKNSADIAARNTVAGDVHNITVKGSQIMDNDFKNTPDYDNYYFTSNDKYFGSNVYSFFDGSATSTPYLRIFRNKFRNSSNIWIQGHPYQSPDKYTLIHSNGFHGLGFDYTDSPKWQSFIQVENSTQVRVAENNIDCSHPNPVQGPGLGKKASSAPDYNCEEAVGIYLDDCTDCTIDGNGNSPEPPISTNEPVKVGGYGIYLKGDLSGTQMACNELDSNDYHMYLEDVTQLNSQGGVVGADNNFMRNTSSIGSADIGGNYGNTFGSITYFHSIGFAPTITIGSGTITPFFQGINSNSCTQTSKNKGNLTPPESTTRIWPNPVRGTLNIEYQGALAKRGIITDLSGRLIRSMNIAPGINTLELEELATGTYFLKVDGEIFKILKTP